jgi:hypothetical protein
MVYSDTTNLNGIIQEVERMADLGQTYISGNASNLKEFTATINRVNHRIWHTIFMSNGNWQYDDGGNTDLPQSVTDLTSGTSKYALPTTALTIQRVEAKDSGGLWTTLSPITKEDIGGEAIDEFMKTDGPLSMYRLIGTTIELFPGPDYSSTGGLKVYYDRDSVDFATSDTTKTPGFASPYHELLPIKATIEWLKVKQPTSPTLPILIQDDLRVEASLKAFYGKRFKDYKPRIGRAYQSYR